MNYLFDKLAPLALCALTATALFACGGDVETTSTGAGGGSGTGGSTADTTTGGGTTLTPEAQVEKFCNDITAPACAAIFACCSDPQKQASYGGSVDACIQGLSADCKDELAPSILPSIKAGATALDEGKLAACVALLESMKPGGAACVRPPVFVVLLDCMAAFQGTIEPGQPCDASNLHDDEFIVCKNGYCIDGTCQPFLAAGDACDPDNVVQGCNFPAGEGCVGPAGAAKCGKQGAVGDACPEPGHDKSVSCQSMSCGDDGTCVAPTAVGICSEG